MVKTALKLLFEPTVGAWVWRAKEGYLPVLRAQYPRISNRNIPGPAQVTLDGRLTDFHSKSPGRRRVSNNDQNRLTDFHSKSPE